jgi:hypothetical protein
MDVEAANVLYCMGREESYQVHQAWAGFRFGKNVEEAPGRPCDTSGSQLNPINNTRSHVP